MVEFEKYIAFAGLQDRMHRSAKFDSKGMH